MRRLTSALCATAMFAGAPTAVAAPADPIGSTVSVVNLVTAELSTERRNLSAGDGVHENELVQAAADARSEFKLLDDTKLALGPGAKLVLDKFVYDAGKSGGNNVAVRLTTGAFRWITGKAEKKAYTINVPSAAITVRGTIFDTYVQPSGTTWVLLHEGAIQACNTRGKCRILDEPGKLLVINQDGDIGVPFRWAGLNGEQGFPFDDAFPFVVTPPSFLSAPVLTREAIITDPVKEKPARKVEQLDDTPKKTAAKPIKSKSKAVTTTATSDPAPLTRIVKVKKRKIENTQIKVVQADPGKPGAIFVKPGKTKRPKDDAVRADDQLPVKVVRTIKPTKASDDDDDDNDRPKRSSEAQTWKDFGKEIASRYTNKVRRPKTSDGNDSNDQPSFSDMGISKGLPHRGHHTGKSHNPG